MPRTFPRICPLCGKPGVSNLSSHLEIVHDLTGLRRTRLLKEAKVSWESKREYISTSVDLPRCSSSSTRKICEPRKRRRPVNETPKTSSTAKKVKLSHDLSLATEPYPDFMFRHYVIFIFLSVSYLFTNKESNYLKAVLFQAKPKI